MRIIVLSSLTRCIRLEFPAVAVWLMMTGSTFLTSISKGYGQVNWSARFSGIGTFSSPRVTDLNGDGTGEVILGAGREEFIKLLPFVGARRVGSRFAKRRNSSGKP